MRILLNDYSGHPFQVQLSRELARRGHDVLHVFSASFQTPKGNLTRLPTDPPGFRIEGIQLDQEFAKDSFIKRRQQEIQTGRLVGRKISSFRPHIVISSNAPLDTQRQIERASRAIGARFVFWLQDLYSVAMASILPRRLPVLGQLVAWLYRRLEFSMLRRSHKVVAITSDFIEPLLVGGVSASKICVIQNWAPIEELVVHERDNWWARGNLAEDGVRAVYSGTLGHKHNAEHLISVAKHLPGCVYVFSEGEGARRLREKVEAEGIQNLKVRGWVAFADLPFLLSSADILIALLEADAGAFSVPSKVLTYLCAGRPILAAIPQANLARRIILNAGAGLVSDPGDETSLVRQSLQLARDEGLRRQMGNNGRAYAAANFDIRVIADRFEQAFAIGS